jgi:amino acid adenylation domain-containing protein
LGATSLLNVCADRLRARGFEVVGVATRDPSVRARFGDARVIDLAASRGDLFGDLEIDCLFSIANDRVLSAAELARARVAAINYHDGPLPKYAGLRATRWAIVNGESTHGVTWHRMLGSVDAGAVLAQATFGIAPRETTRSLDLKCYERAIATFETVLDRIDANDLEGTQQDLTARTYHSARRRIPNDGRFPWTMAATQIDALVRSTRGGFDDDEWGRVTLRLPSGRAVVVGATELPAEATSALAGSLLAVVDSHADVATGAGILRITQLHDLDGRPLAFGTIARTDGLAIGARLGDAGADRCDGVTDRLDAAARPALVEGDDALSRFRAAARAHPDAIALASGADPMTYAAIDARSDRLASSLAAMGVSVGRIVAILLEPSADFVTTAIAVWKCGGAYLPLEIDSPRDRLQRIVDTAAPALVVTRRALGPRLTEGVAQLDLEDFDERRSSTTDVATHTPRASDLAYVIFTSGSSGTPKGTLVEHGSLAQFLSVDVAHHGITRADRILQLCSVAFDASVEEMWSALTTGATLFLRPPDMLASFDRFFEWCRFAQLTVIGLFPSQLSDAVDAMERVGFPPSIRLVTTGGEAVRRADVVRWQAYFQARSLPPPKLVNVYGLTETTIASLTCDLTNHPLASEVVPIGTPLPGTLVRILDGDAAVPRGGSGELCIGGFGVARGYLHRDDLTAERFVRDPLDPSGRSRLFRTGDRARALVDGGFELLGRLDRQVKLRGARVELDEIEVALASHTSVRVCAVEVRLVANGAKRLVAFVVAERIADGPNDADLEAQLRAFLSERLPPYMRPHAYVFLERMPLTNNGKIARAALELPAPRPRNDADAATGLMSDRVRAIFESVLGVSAVRADDDFFELGGDSHAAVQLVAALEACTGVRLPLDVLIDGATVDRLTALLHLHHDDDRDDVAAIPLRVGTSRPIYCLQTHAGDVQAYATVAAHVPEAMTLIGLRYGGSARALRQHCRDLESLARRFVAKITARDPDGPYALLGYSWGGLLAYEVARQLIAAGREVTFLGLIGSEQRQAIGEQTLSRLRRLLVPRELLGMFRRVAARALGIADEDVDAPAPIGEPATVRALVQLNFELADRYTTRPAGLRVIHLIRERDAASVGDPYGYPPERRWRAWTGCEVRVLWTSGTHDTCMSAPNAERTAERIVEALRDADSLALRAELTPTRAANRATSSTSLASPLLPHPATSATVRAHGDAQEVRSRGCRERHASDRCPGADGDGE